MFTRLIQRPFLSMWIWTLVLHSVLFISLFVGTYVHTHATDGGQYIAIAQNILSGNGFSLRLEPPYIPDSIRTPGYPYFLAGWMRSAGNPHASLWFTMLIGTLIPLIGMCIARMMTDDRRQWLVVGIVLSLDLNLWYYSFILGSEGLFLPLCALGIGLAAWALSVRSWKIAFAAGVATGLAALVRPIVQFVPILFALVAVGFSLKDKKALRQAARMSAACVVAYAIIVAPWLYRNAKLFGVWDYANVGWFNMYTRVAATAEAIATHRPYDEMRIEYLQRLHEKGYVQKTPVEEQDVHGYAFTPVFQKETVLAIQRYPRETLISHISAAWTVVSQDNSVLVFRNLGWANVAYPSFSPMVVLFEQGPIALIRNAMGLVATPWAFAMVARVIWLCIFALAFLSPFTQWRRSPATRPVVVFLWFYMLGIVALSLNAAAQADGRYRSQFIFVEIPLALVAFQYFFTRTKRSSKEHRECRACATRSWTVLFGKRDVYSLWRCGLCGSITVDPMPSEETRKAVYSKDYFFGGHAGGGYANYDADKKATRATYERMLDLIQPYQTSSARLLDIGSATGIFLGWAKERGWSVAGQEISEEAAHIATENGIPTTTESFQDIPGTYQAISMLDVIEHLDTPRAAVRLLKEKLEPGGVLLINTPDAGSLFANCLRSHWHALCPPEHVVIFSQKGLVALLEQEGMECVWIGKIPKQFRLSYIVGTASRWLRWRWMHRIERWLHQHPRDDISFLLPLRDNVAVVAQKRIA